MYIYKIYGAIMIRDQNPNELHTIALKLTSFGDIIINTGIVTRLMRALFQSSPC